MSHGISTFTGSEDTSKDNEEYDPVLRKEVEREARRLKRSQIVWSELPVVPACSQSTCAENMEQRKVAWDTGHGEAQSQHSQNEPDHPCQNEPGTLQASAGWMIRIRVYGCLSRCRRKVHRELL